MANKRIPIFYSARLNRDCWARVFLNDIPLYKGQYIGPDSASGPCNNLLVPGENELSVHLLKVPTSAAPGADLALVAKDALVLELYEVTNPDAPDTAKLERRIIADARYPQLLETATEERFKRVPFHFRTKFFTDTDIDKPPFLEAPKSKFDCDGTPELHAAVTELHASLEKRQWEDFLDLLALKLDHGERALRGEAQQTAAQKRDTFRNELFAYDPRPQPLSLDDLHFEPRRGGTVAYVTRKDGGHALTAPCAKDPKRCVRTDFLFTKSQGTWRVFA